MKGTPFFFSNHHGDPSYLPLISANNEMINAAANLAFICPTNMLSNDQLSHKGLFSYFINKLRLTHAYCPWNPHAGHLRNSRHSITQTDLPECQSRQIRLLAAAAAQSSLFVASSAILVVVASLVRWLQDGPCT